MGEALRRALEAGAKGDDLTFTMRPAGLLELLEVLADDAFDAADVDEVEGEGAATGQIEPTLAVLLTESQEFLRLPQPGPREVSREQSLHKATQIVALLSGLVDQPLRIAQRVGRELLRVVVVVGGAAAGRLLRVDPDQGAVAVDAHELAVGPHPDALADVARGNGIKRPLEADVVIGVDLAPTPAGRIEALPGEAENREDPDCREAQEQGMLE